MSQTITITQADLLNQVKISGKIPEITEGIINRKIIENVAAEKGIKVEDEELQKAADQMRLMYGLISADDTWTWLKKHSLSLDDYQELVYNTVLQGKLAGYLFGDKVEPYFFENQLNYASVVMYEVILDDEDLALELFYGIKEGEMSYYDVAHKYIQDTELRRKGGYLGKVERRNLKPEIAAAVFMANPPQLLKPIVTSKGIHLILVEEIIQPSLNEKLRLEILSQLFSQWLKEQIQNPEIIENF